MQGAQWSPTPWGARHHPPRASHPCGVLVPRHLLLCHFRQAPKQQQEFIFPILTCTALCSVLTNFTPIPTSPGLTLGLIHTQPLRRGCQQKPSLSPTTGLINITRCDCEIPFPTPSVSSRSRGHSEIRTQAPCPAFAPAQQRVSPRMSPGDREPEGMAGSGGHGFPAPSNKQALPSGRERREEGREGGKRPKRDVFLQAGRLGAGRGVLAAGAGLLPLSVNGCRLLPAAAATGRWGRGGPGRCLLLGQVAISDFGSRGFARSSWTQAASEEYPFPSLHWRSCSAPRPLVQAPPNASHHS